MGLMGFEFVEFTSPQPGVLEAVFEKLGFTLVAKHRSKDVVLYRQNGINFILNRRAPQPGGVLWRRAWPIGLRPGLPRERCAQGLQPRTGTGRPAHRDPHRPHGAAPAAIMGIGGAPLYLIDRFEDGKSIYDIDFKFIEGVDRRPWAMAVNEIDHLTHNVYRGRMGFWANFYEKLFNFRGIRPDIQGEYTGLTSKAMTAPDGKIRIPLNEESKRAAARSKNF